MATQVFPTVPGSGGSTTAATFSGMFGDGADGNYTVIAGATLSPGRERHYADLTVQATGKVAPAGFKLFVSGTLTNAGLIHDDGNSATDSSGGGGLGDGLRGFRGRLPRFVGGLAAACGGQRNGEGECERGEV